MKSFQRKLKSFLLLCSILFGVLFTPQICLKIKYKDSIFEQIDPIPPQEFAVVFGAWVKEDYSLSDVTKERVEASVRLYKAGKVRKLFLSGDNRSNRQAEAMAEYATRQGVGSNDIVVDKLGIDTNDTCKHFARIGREAVLVTQGYHLPRTMLMCTTSKIQVLGLAADQLHILSTRGDDLFQIYTTRAWRATREAALTWLFVFGIYDKLSTEAEIIEQTGE